ncbi:MAG TPA: hypothetical protein VKD22_06990, partial [Ramlibacter sp.]|nr:hypothetical protein [Ramlibacter sp.]
MSAAKIARRKKMNDKDSTMESDVSQYAEALLAIVNEPDEKARQQALVAIPVGSYRTSPTEFVELAECDGQRTLEVGCIVTDRYHDGRPRVESWRLKGELHRRGGPAGQDWYEDGQLACARCYDHGQPHCDDGPARREWYPDGTPREETWIVRGMDHRAGGP